MSYICVMQFDAKYCLFYSVNAKRHICIANPVCCESLFFLININLNINSVLLTCNNVDNFDKHIKKCMDETFIQHQLFFYNLHYS